MKTKTGHMALEFGGVLFDCEYTYSPGTPDTWYRSNGDPGDPGEPEEFEITAMRVRNQQPVLGYHISWPDGTATVATHPPASPSPDCKIVPLVAKENSPCLLDSLNDLGIDPDGSLAEAAGRELDNIFDQEEADRAEAAARDRDLEP